MALLGDGRATRAASAAAPPSGLAGGLPVSPAKAREERILKEVEDTVRSHYKSFAPRAFDSFKGIARNEASGNLVEQLEELLRARKSVQATADAIQNLIWTTCRVSIIERGTRRNNSKGPKGVRARARATARIREQRAKITVCKLLTLLRCHFTS